MVAHTVEWIQRYLLLYQTSSCMGIIGNSIVYTLAFGAAYINRAKFISQLKCLCSSKMKLHTSPHVRTKVGVTLHVHAYTDTIIRLLSEFRLVQIFTCMTFEFLTWYHIADDGGFVLKGCATPLREQECMSCLWQMACGSCIHLDLS